MIPQDSLQAILSMLTSERITYKGSEVLALNKILNDVNTELNSQRVAQRVTPQGKPELAVVKPEPGPRAAVAEDFTATG